jgi:hypothetical protein
VLWTTSRPNVRPALLPQIAQRNSERLIIGIVRHGSAVPSSVQRLAALRRHNSIDDVQRRTTAMILSTVRVEDFERFWNTFSTKGAEKRKQHGSKGSQVFRDPNDDNRVWVLFDWDEEGYKNLLSDPEMPGIFQEAGLEGRPQTAELARQIDV